METTVIDIVPPSGCSDTGHSLSLAISLNMKQRETSTLDPFQTRSLTAGTKDQDQTQPNPRHTVWADSFGGSDRRANHTLLVVARRRSSSPPRPGGLNRRVNPASGTKPSSGYGASFPTTDTHTHTLSLFVLPSSPQLRDS